MKRTKIRASAKGEMCTLLLLGFQHDPATTVLAHTGSGSGKRNDDLEACYACVDCHDAIDYRNKYYLSDDPITQAVLHRTRRRDIGKAIAATHLRLKRRGLMK